jgi:F420-0:gamma-glutamyl ligase-like protein
MVAGRVKIWIQYIYMQGKVVGTWLHVKRDEIKKQSLIPTTRHTVTKEIDPLYFRTTIICKTKKRRL